MVQENHTLNHRNIRLLAKEKEGPDGLSIYCICSTDRAGGWAQSFYPRTHCASAWLSKPYQQMGTTSTLLSPKKLYCVLPMSQAPSEELPAHDLNYCSQLYRAIPI